MPLIPLYLLLTTRSGSVFIKSESRDENHDCCHGNEADQQAENQGYCPIDKAGSLDSYPSDGADPPDGAQRPFASLGICNGRLPHPISNAVLVVNESGYPREHLTIFLGR